MWCDFLKYPSFCLFSQIIRKIRNNNKIRGESKYRYTYTYIFLVNSQMFLQARAG